jgi:hypothetical protein
MAEEKKVAKKDYKTVYINGLARANVIPAYELEKNEADGKWQTVLNEDGTNKLSDNYVIASVYDNKDTRYSFRIPKSLVFDSKTTTNDNVNIRLREYEGKTMRVTVREKGAESNTYTDMLPSKLAEIQNEKLASLHKEKSEFVYLNNFKEDSKVFGHLKTKDQSRFTVFDAGGVGYSVSVSNSHVFEDKKRPGNFTVRLMNDSKYPATVRDGEEYKQVFVLGEDLAKYREENLQQMREYAKQADAAAEAEAPEAPVVEADELEA